MVSATSKQQKKDADNFGVEALKSEISVRIRESIRESGGNAFVAEKSGLPLRTISNYVRGLSEPKIISLSKIAEVCGVSLDWLATGKNHKFSSEPQPALDKEALEEGPAQTIADIGQRLRHSREVCEEAVQAVGWEPPAVVWEALRTMAFGYDMKVEDAALFLESIKCAIEIKK